MQASSEICTLLAAWLASWGTPSNATRCWADLHLSHGAELHTIGTDPGEWLEGEAAFTHMRQEMNQRAGIKFLAGEIGGYEEGTVGWGMAQATLILPEEKRVPMRLTAVFHQEESDWKMVQMHASIGMPNEQLLRWEGRPGAVTPANG